MEYPITEQLFCELVAIRGRMVRENPKPDRIGIAWPFVPWVGQDILEGAPGIYFVGKATRGCFGTSDKFENCREYSREITSEAPRGSYWPYIKELTRAVYAREYSDCTRSIACSNQFKIGIFNRDPPESRNPAGVYEEIQLPMCKSIMEREFQLADSCAFIFIGDGPLIYPIVGEKDSWNTERYKECGIWLKYRNNGAPVFFQDHPTYLKWKRPQSISKHVDIIASHLRKYLGPDDH